MPSVFHYTDAAGLLGILRSESLFATDYRYLNDTAERGVIRELLMPILEAEIADITPKLVQKGWLDKKFYEELGLRVHGMEAGSMCRSIMTGMDNVSPLFVLSFCKHEEDSDAFENGLLSQWRGYAGSAGFAIEFDVDKLHGLMEKEVKLYAYARLKADDIRYEKYEEVFDPAAYRGVAAELMRQIFKHHGVDISEVTGRVEIDTVVQHLMAAAPFLKHPGFHEEKEYRITAPCFRRSKASDDEKDKVKKIKTRVRNGLVTPYIELFEDFSVGSAIKAIIVGPHPQQDKQAEAVRMALESENIDATVRCSDIPYRA